MTNIFDTLAAEHYTPPQMSECPFCDGSPNTIKRSKDIDGNTQHAVFCPRCDAHGPNRSNELEAIAAWNNRKEYHGTNGN
jgi:Lar family restriction alleviation protein